MSYLGFLSETGSVYRLPDLDDPDFSSSEEGEITEVWTQVGSVKCRTDRYRAPTHRLSGGLVESGQTMIFFKADDDVRDADRIIIDGTVYRIDEVYPIKRKSGRVHHQESLATVIDWSFS
jgi:hypothetical protein